MPPLQLVEEPLEGRSSALGTGVSAAIMRRVARGDLPATARIHRTGRSLAFGRVDRLSPGYRQALAIAREHGYEPVERMAGGRAAVFHEGTLAFSKASREPALRTGMSERFAEMAEIVAGALRRVGLDARIGEIEGEYCPGEWSVNEGGRTKIAGIGQRVIAGGAHTGGVLVVRGAEQIREVLVPVYEALGLEWDPATAGSVADALGAAPPPVEGPDPLLRRGHPRLPGGARRALRGDERRGRRADDAHGRGATELPHPEATVGRRPSSAGFGLGWRSRRGCLARGRERHVGVAGGRAWLGLRGCFGWSVLTLPALGRQSQDGVGRSDPPLAASAGERSPWFGMVGPT